MSMGNLFVKAVRLDDDKVWDKYIQDGKMHLVGVGANKTKTHTNYVFFIDAKKIRDVKFLLAKNPNIDVGHLFVPVDGGLCEIGVGVNTLCRLHSCLQDQVDEYVKTQNRLDIIRRNVFGPRVMEH